MGSHSLLEAERHDLTDIKKTAWAAVLRIDPRWAGIEAGRTARTQGKEDGNWIRGNDEGNTKMQTG